MTNRKNTKRALFASVISMLLCVTMLVGSTFAWFTDNESTNVNTIYAGTLEIDLLDGSGNNLEGATLSFTDQDSNPYWEPGCTYTLPTVYIQNNGNLAVKYEVEITGINGDALLNEVIDWTISYGYEQDETEGHLIPGQKLPITISGTMQTTAGNEYQGLSISGIAIAVRAAQDTVEYDSTTDQYDAAAPYCDEWDGTQDGAGLNDNTDTDAKTIKIDSAEQLAALIAEINAGNKYENYTITLNKNLDLEGQAWTSINGWNGVLNGTTIDGNGHSIMNMRIVGGDSAGFISNNASSVTIKNLTFDNAYVKTTDGNQKYAGVVMGKNYSAVTIENVHVINSQVLCTWQCGGLVGFAEGNGPTFVNCSISNSFVGGSNCTSGAFFGLGAVDITVNGGKVSNVDLYTDMEAGLVGHLYGKTLTNNGCEIMDLAVVSAYPVN